MKKQNSSAGRHRKFRETDEPVEPDRLDNLWEPVPGDHGAHGKFGDRANDLSPQLWVNKNRNWLAMAAAGLTGFVLGAVIKKGN